MMKVAGAGGVLLLLIGLVWIGQGLNVVLGSPMTGKPIFALLGVVVAVAGGWLLWTATHAGRSVGRP